MYYLLSKGISFVFVYNTGIYILLSSSVFLMIPRLPAYEDNYINLQIIIFIYFEKLFSGAGKFKRRFIW